MLRINVWISTNGLKQTAYSEFEFPYNAISVVSNKRRVFNNIEDVYDEIVELYNISKEQGYEIGKSLYAQCAFFTSYERLLDSKHQITIKEYNYCKTFNCSLYPSMQETPSSKIDDFMIIEQEYQSCVNKEQNGKN